MTPFASPRSPSSSSAPASTASRPPGTSPRRRGRARRRQDRRRRRRLGHRLRRRAQQLLPARDAGADGRLRRDLGVRPRGAALPRLGLHRARPAGAGAATSSRCSSASSASATRPSCIVGERDGRRRTCARCTPTGARPGLTVCLHEHAGGFAFNRESMLGLADKARAAGAADRRGRRGHRLRARRLGRGDARAHERRATSPSSRSWSRSARGSPRCGRCSACRDRLDVRQPDGAVARDLPMWTYWYLQEGEVEVDPATFVTADGQPSPVLHVDSDAAAARRRRAR